MPRGHLPGPSLPRIPDGVLNAGSKHSTPACLIFEAHYLNLNLEARCTWDRYLRLCEFLQLTPYELASIIRIKHSTVDFLQSHNHLPDIVGPTASLIFALFENQVSGNWRNDTVESPFPTVDSLGKLADFLKDA